jgi:peptide deformylase
MGRRLSGPGVGLPAAQRVTTKSGARQVALRSIVRFPDSRLRTPAEAVRLFDEALLALAGDLVDSLRSVRGLGITAPHIGVLLRLVVIELPDAESPRFYVNPWIELRSADRVRREEGSISMPGVAEIVERAARVRMRYQDMSGEVREIDADGLLAVCLQHEIDQLDGIFWIQRLSKLRRDRLLRRFEKRRTNKPDW